MLLHTLPVFDNNHRPLPSEENRRVWAPKHPSTSSHDILHIQDNRRVVPSGTLHTE